MLKNSRTHISGIMKTILISGIIEIICVVAAISINIAQQNQYNNIIECGYSASENLNAITSNIYRLQNIAYNYYTNYNSGEDYQLEVKENADSTNKYIECLSKNIKSENSDSSDSLYSQYNLYLQNINYVVNGDKSYSDVSKDIITDGESISALCGSLQIKNENQIIYQSKNIDKFNAGLIVVYIIIVATIILSIIVTVCITHKNGDQIMSEQKKTEIKAKEAKKEAYTDNLTSLWNRKYIELKINSIIKESKTGCLFMIDMDNFKKVNDTYGHIAGDNILKAFGKALIKSTRPYDICCRAGGDEFMLFALNLSKEQAEILVKRIISNSKSEFANVKGGNVVTLSIGIQQLEPNMTYKTLYDKADNALYYVKENGKGNYFIN